MRVKKVQKGDIVWVKFSHLLWQKLLSEKKDFISFEKGGGGKENKVKVQVECVKDKTQKYIDPTLRVASFMFRPTN